MGKDAIVAGTGFEGRAKIIRQHVREGTPVKLRREPSNPHDPNAIAVLIAVPHMFGLFGARDACIGYLKSGAAKGLAPKIDAGTEVSGVVRSFYAPPEQEHPRVSLRLEWADP
jgi:hypothetical protein